MRPSILLLGMAVAAATAVPASAQFVTYTYNATGSLCAAYMPTTAYTVVGEATQDIVEATLSGYLSSDTAKKILPIVPRDCYTKVMRLTCLTSFPRFNAAAGAPYATCTNMCTMVQDACAGFLAEFNGVAGDLDAEAQQLVQLFFGANCSDPTAFATTTCTSTSIISSRVSQPACPAPLVANPFSNESDAMVARHLCIGQCCATCPFPYNLYPSGFLQQHQNTEYSINIVSFFTATFVMISYMLLPDKRDFPGIFILNLSIGLVLFHFPAFLTVGHGNQVLCHDIITEAIQGDNAACGIQAFFLVFGIISSACWFFVLVLNLHLSIVWRSKLLRNYTFVLHGICWLAPLILTLIPLANNGAGFDYGSFCLVNQTWRNGVLFYPLAVLIFGAFVLNIGTSLKIFQISRSSQLDMKEIIAVQLRPFLFSLGYLFIFLFFWLLDFTQTSKLANDAVEVFTRWVQCIVLLGMTQDQCYQRDMGLLPSLGLRVTADVLVGVVGLWTFGFFAAKKRIFEEWRDLIFGPSDFDENFDYTEKSSHGTDMNLKNMSSSRVSSSVGVVRGSEDDGCRV